MKDVDDAPPGWLSAAREGRHAIHQFDDGAVLIDLDTGDLSQLNASAAFVYEHLAQGAAQDEVADILSTRFAIPRSHALQDVSSFLRLKPAATPTAPPEERSPFKYVAAGEHFAVEQAGVPLFYVDRSGRWITTAEGQMNRLRAALLWVAPKLLTLQGHSVLHASAVSIGGRATAFSGSSGAGKTTLARTLAAAGALLLAEDSFVVRMNPATKSMSFIPLEAAAVLWADRVQAGIGPLPCRLSCDALLSSDEPAVVALDSILFVDVARREGLDLRSVPLGRTAATVGLLQNLFWASTDNDTYRRALSWAAQASGLVRLGSLTVPEGIPQLISASQRYARNTAS